MLLIKNAVATIGAQQRFIKPHCPWTKGRLNGSTAPSKPSGHTDSPSPQTVNAPAPLRLGSITTTMNETTQP